MRYAILAASVLMQLCLGATYSWSIFINELKLLSGIGQGWVQLPFTVFYVVFPATTLFAGALIEHLGPRRCAMAGGLLFGGGWILAGLLGRMHFAFTILGIGLLGGAGVGLAYLVPITTCVLWFPRQKGLVTGIAVAGFGGGAALVAAVAGHWLEASGWTPFDCFRWLGMIFAAAIACAGTIMKRPAESESPTGIGIFSADSPPVFRQPAFRALYAAMLANLMAGFAVNANIKQLVPGLSMTAGATAVGCFALANAAGRVLWGLAFDRMRASAAILTNSALQAGLLLTASWILRSEKGLYTFAAITGFNYGGVLVLYAATTARLWGAERMGRVYGRLFSANIPASVAPVLAGLAYDAFHSFAPALAAIAALCLASAVAVRHDRTIAG